MSDTTGGGREPKKKRGLTYSMQSPMRTLFSFHGTVLPMVLFRQEVYVFTILHAILWVVKDLELWTDWAQYTLSFNALSISSTFMVFSLVFFNQQCFTRYTELYGAVTGISGTLQEITQLTAVHLRLHDGERWDACRYLLASAFMIYMKVTDPPGQPAAIDKDEWDRLINSEEVWLGKPVVFQHKNINCPALLTETEMKVLQGFNGNTTVLLQTWALRCLKQGYRRAKVDGATYSTVEEAVLRLRRHCAFITNTLALPVPFPYYHALILLMYVNYLLFAFTFLTLNSYLTIPAFLVIIIVATGVREVSSALANPFGDDEVDFPVSKYMRDLRCLVSVMATNMSWAPDRAPEGQGGLDPAAAAAQQQYQQYQQYQQMQMMAQQPQRGGTGKGGLYPMVPGAQLPPLTAGSQRY